MDYVKPNDDVDEIIERYPQVVDFFSEKEIVCVKCGEPVWGTIETIIKEKYNNVEDIIKQLNQYIHNSKKD
jgi:iron-sulfur cluster repair protein YtfE (RIC family)